MSKRVTKYVYCRVLQGNYGGQWCNIIWCDQSDEQEVKDFRADVKNHKQNEPNVAFRVVGRRMLRGASRPW